MLTPEQRLRNLECPRGKIDMLLDTDAYNEIDDQFAISYALHAGEKLNVKALYAAPFFNARSTGPADGMERSYQEILKLLRLSGMERPVFRGSTEYLPDEKTFVASEAAEDLSRRAMTYSAEAPLYVVAIGAITNVASALLLKPEIKEKIVLVWLGGHSEQWFDTNEFNMMQDVAGARVVFGCGCPLVQLPCMGVASTFIISGPELEYWLKGQNPLCDYLARHTIEAAEQYAAGRVWSRVIWDVTAVAWLLNDHDRFMFSEIIPALIPQYDHHYSHDVRRHPMRRVTFINRDALMQELVETLRR